MRAAAGELWPEHPLVFSCSRDLRLPGAPLRPPTAIRRDHKGAAASDKSKSPRSRRVSPEASTEPPSHRLRRARRCDGRAGLLPRGILRHGHGRRLRYLRDGTADGDRRAGRTGHGAAPVLVVAEFLLSPYSLAATWREATLLAWWPATYLTVVATLSWSGAATMPYLFLRPSRFGAVAVTAAVAGLFAVVVALSVALAATHRAVRRHHHTMGTR
jgi:hypothetical protein